MNLLSFQQTNKKANSEISGNFFLNAILKSKKQTQKVAHRLRDWLMISGCESMCDSSAVDVGSCARECSAAPVKLGERTTAREGERESESSVGASLCYFAALCLSLCLRSLARVCTMRCLAECIFNGVVGVADAHFANWNVYKPGEQLPQYSLLFTFASGLVSSGRSGVWFGPQRTNERKNTQYSLWGDRWA